jgi:DNA-binding SARP family transcriptional activator/Tfp pilus assembly protein PilF/Cdc6-like AAA superfamily ATPase
VDYRCTILGPTQVLVDGAPIPLGDSAKVRGTLAILLLHARESVSPTELIDRVWTDSAGLGDAHGTLMSYVSRARARLKAAGLPITIRHSRAGYRLDADPARIDYHYAKILHQRAAAALEQGDPTRARALLREAVALWAEEPLLDLSSDWAADERVTMAVNDLLPLYQALIDVELGLDLYDSALSTTSRLLKQHEFNDRLIMQMMRAMDGAGRHHDLPDFYRGVRNRMIERFGTEPSPVMDALFQQLLQRRLAAPSIPATVDLPPAARTAAAPARSTQPPPMTGAPPMTGPAPVVPADLFTPPRQLLPGIHDFTGRTAQLAQLDALLHAGETTNALTLITIDGPPGVGKTTLITHWAHQVADHFPDGQIYLDLNGFGPAEPTDPATALSAVLVALGRRADELPARLEERAATLRTITSARRLLLIFDNARDADQIRPLLPSSPHCLVVVTSRSRLPSLAMRESAHRVSVPPMPIEEARALLTRVITPQRAQTDLPAVDAMTTHCGGLPLALRVSAAHTLAFPDTPLQDLAAHLGQFTDQFDTDDEHEDPFSLAAAFSFSYNALPPDAQRCFRLLSQHPGAEITTSAAAALLDERLTRARRHLHTLAEANLLDTRHQDRYRLHDLLRAYATHRFGLVEATAQARREVIARILDYYLQTAHNADRRRAPHRDAVAELPATTTVVAQTFATDRDAASWLLAERHNLAAATALAAEHGFHHHAWRLPGTLRKVLERNNLHHDSLALHTTALASARAVGDSHGQASILKDLGTIHLNLQQPDEAVACLNEALAIARESQYRLVEGACLHNLGRAYLALGDVDRARTHYRDALDLRREIGDHDGVGYTLHRLGLSHCDVQEYDVAVTHLRQALQVRERIQHYQGQADTLAALARVYLRQGSSARAIEYAQRALPIHDRTLDHRTAIDTLLVLATARFNLHHYQDSVRAGDRAAELCREINDPAGRAQALDVLACAHHALGAPELSDRLREQASAIRTALALPDDRETGIDVAGL